MRRGMRNEVREPLEGDHIAVMEVLPDGLGKRQDFAHEHLLERQPGGKPFWPDQRDTLNCPQQTGLPIARSTNIVRFAIFVRIPPKLASVDLMVSPSNHEVVAQRGGPSFS
jgi:hypothetical protein